MVLSIHLRMQEGELVHISFDSASVVQVRDDVPLISNPASQLTLHEVPYSLVQGNRVNPLCGGLKSSHSFGLQYGARPDHLEEGRHVQN